jgi:AraC-like DNA-binding protein
MTILSSEKSQVSDVKCEKSRELYSLSKGFYWKLDKERGHSFYLPNDILKFQSDRLNTHIVNSREMFLTEGDNFYTIEVVKQAQVMNNYRKVKNVQILATLANCSASSFINRRFHRSFKDSLYGWMQKQRAKQVLVEFEHGIKPLQENAEEYKFSSCLHFSIFCKKQFVLSPRRITN